MSTFGIEDWIIGVTLSTVGCTMSNMGVNLQKLTHNRLQAEAKVTGTLRSAYAHPLWILGLTSVIVGSVCDLVAFGFADMSLLAPLGAMTLVINMLIAPCFLGEKLTIRDIIATAIILGGTVLSLAFGSKSQTTYTLEELMKMFFKDVFVIYAVIAFILLASIFSWLYYLKRLRVRGNPISDRMQRVERLLYPFLAGFFGAHSVLFAKSAAEVVKMTIKGENQFVFVGSYFLVVGLGAFLFMQMRFLNEALERCDALLVVPVYQVCWVIMNTVVGMSYFQDYKDMTDTEVLLFTLGVVITVVGVYILAQRDQTDDSIELDSSSMLLPTVDEELGLATSTPDTDSGYTSGYTSGRNSGIQVPLTTSHILSMPSGTLVYDDNVHSLNGSRSTSPRLAANGYRKDINSNMSDHNADLHLAEQVERDLHSKKIFFSNDVADTRITGIVSSTQRNDGLVQTDNTSQFHHTSEAVNSPSDDFAANFDILNVPDVVRLPTARRLSSANCHQVGHDHQTGEPSTHVHAGLDPVEAATSSPLALFGASSIISAVTGRRSRSSSIVGGRSRASSFNDAQDGRCLYGDKDESQQFLAPQPQINIPQSKSVDVPCDTSEPNIEDESHKNVVSNKPDNSNKPENHNESVNNSESPQFTAQTLEEGSITMIAGSAGSISGQYVPSPKAVTSPTSQNTDSKTDNDIVLAINDLVNSSSNEAKESEETEAVESVLKTQKGKGKKQKNRR